MDFQQSERAYYRDFLFTPILAGAVGFYVLLGGDAAYTALAALAGLFLWTFAEYWIHRVLFHHVFRTAHRLHHIRPQGFDAAPWWLTMTAQVGFAAGLIYAVGLSIGGGIFLGLEAGYLAYIVVHDRIHHGPKAARGYWRAVARRHAIHHRGLEVNFGVITAAWDRVFGTFDAR